MQAFMRVSLTGLLVWGASLVRSPAQAIHLNAGGIDTVQAAAPARMSAEFPGKRLHLVQFAGPIQPEWVETLTQAGYQIVDYIPDNAYLVYGGAAALKSVRARAQHLRWEGAYLAGDKINSRAKAARGKAQRAPADGNDLFAVQLVRDDVANADTVALLTALAKEPLKRNRAFRHYRNLVVRLDPAEVETIAARPDVISIAPYATPHKLDERQGIIVSGQLTGDGPAAPGYLAWLGTKGFTQQQFTNSGLVVNVTDSGLDNGTNVPNHFGLYVSGNTGLASRVVYNRLEGTPNSGSTLQGCDGHGTLNAHVIGAYNNGSSGFPHQDSAGYRYGLGIAPFVKLGSSVIFDPDDYTDPVFPDLMSRAFRDGARISSESWGSDTYGGYDVDSQEYDALVRDAQPDGSAVPVAGNQGLTIVVAAGNAGPGAGTVGSPATAKNVIAVGAAENVHSHAITNRGTSTLGMDGCDSPDTEADSANDMAVFSSRGPCSDGRAKPDLVAPGTHVTGGVAQQTRTMAGTGNDLACFTSNGSGICGLKNDANEPTKYFPTNQQWTTTSSGTSHSTPAVSGGAALVWQYFINQGWGAPSPAMVKAFLVNSTRYMDGLDAGDTLWSNTQGFGMMNLGLAFDGVARVRRDQRTNDTFTASGQARAISGVPSDTNKPVRITLSWTDAPGSTAGDAYNNDLDLRVSAGGIMYVGNVFNGPISTNGGAADAKNNVESVFLPAGTTGAVAVVVRAANINSDGVPNVAPALDQDYALVIYNFTEAQMPVVVDAGATLAAEGCDVGNGSIDPGETVTVAFALQNVGTAHTTNVVATLLATGGVASPSGAQTYGALLAGGAPATNSFTFAASGTCGGTLTATLALDDNGLNLGTAALTFRLGGATNYTQAATNSAVITLNDNAAADPYPSTIGIANLTGTISKVTATLRGFGHGYPEDMDIVLVSPDGQKVCLMGAAGGGTSNSAITLTFDDAAASQIPDPMVSGTYLPTGIATNMNSPAPEAPYASALAAFNGGNPNGDWKLYARDAAMPDSGSITQGWSLVVTAEKPVCCGGGIVSPRIGAFYKTNGPAVAARLTSETGRTYRLDFSPNLATNPVLWTPVASNLGTGGEITLVDTNLADLKRYYRVTVP